MMLELHLPKSHGNRPESLSSQTQEEADTVHPFQTRQGVPGVSSSGVSSSAALDFCVEALWDLL